MNSRHKPNYRKASQKWVMYMSFESGFKILPALVVILAGSVPLVFAQTGASVPVPVSGGIWKAAVPPNAMHGEFANMDAFGLAVGAKIPADCSLNWVNPDDGKLYCFVSGTSLVVFLEHPHANIDSARGYWSTQVESKK